MREIEDGNSGLKDERMHDMQIFGMWRNFMLQVCFTRSIDTYASVKRLSPAPTLQLLMQPVNIDVLAIAMCLVGSRQIRAWTPDPWLRSRGNFACFLPCTDFMLIFAFDKTIIPTNEMRYGTERT